MKRNNQNSTKNLVRWPFPTNHKDIGTPHSIFGAIAGVMGTCFSVPIRMELAQPGDQIIGGNHQPHNVSITAHASPMIPFMVANHLAHPCPDRNRESKPKLAATTPTASSYYPVP